MQAVKEKPINKPLHSGHRERLREKLLSMDGEGLYDYELLELVLFNTIPRRDVKPLAKKLIQAAGSFWQVFQLPRETLKKEFKLSDPSIALLRLMCAVGKKMGQEEVLNKPILSSWRQLLSYCQAAMAHEPIEQTRVLFLDRKNILIADEILNKGTLDHTPIYPREVVKRALDLNAGAIILLHNHPSGDPSPSEADIIMTTKIQEAADIFNIYLHDHIIISKTGHTSFRDKGLIK